MRLQLAVVRVQPQVVLQRVEVRDQRGVHVVGAPPREAESVGAGRGVADRAQAVAAQQVRVGVDHPRVGQHGARQVEHAGRPGPARSSPSPRSSPGPTPTAGAKGSGPASVPAPSRKVRPARPGDRRPRQWNQHLPRGRPEHLGAVATKRIQHHRGQPSVQSAGESAGDCYRRHCGRVPAARARGGCACADPPGARCSARPDHPRAALKHDPHAGN